MSYEQSTHLSYLALGGKETNEIPERSAKYREEEKQMKYKKMHLREIQEEIYI